MPGENRLGNATIGFRADVRSFVRNIQQANRAVTGQQLQMERLRRQMERTSRGFARLSRAARGWLLQVSAIATTGGAGFGFGQAAQTFVDLDRQIVRLRTQIGLSAEQAESLRQSVLRLSPELGRGPDELAQGLFDVASAGFRGAQAVDVLTAAAQGASIGLGTVQQTTELVTRVLNTWTQDALTAADATGVLLATVREGSFDPAKLSGAFAQVGAVAENLGLTLDETGAALAALSRTQPIERAATGLRGVLSALIKPSNSAKTALEEVGLTIRDVQRNIRAEGFFETILDVTQRLGRAGIDVSQVFRDVEGLSAVLALTGGNLEATRAIFQNLQRDGQDGAAVLTEAWTVFSDSIAGQLDRVTQQINEFGVALAEGAAPVVIDALRVIADNMRLIGEAVLVGFGVFIARSAASRALISGVGVILRAFTSISAASLALSGVLRGTAVLMRRVLLPIAVIEGGIQIIRFIGNLRDSMESLGVSFGLVAQASAVELIAAIIQGVDFAANSITEFFGFLADASLRGFRAAADIARGYYDTLTAFFDGLVEEAAAFVADVISFISSIPGFAVDVFKRALDALKRFFGIAADETKRELDSLNEYIELDVSASLTRSGAYAGTAFAASFLEPVRGIVPAWEGVVSELDAIRPILAQTSPDDLLNDFQEPLRRREFQGPPQPPPGVTPSVNAEDIERQLLGGRTRREAVEIARETLTSYFDAIATAEETLQTVYDSRQRSGAVSREEARQRAADALGLDIDEINRGRQALAEAARKTRDDFLRMIGIMKENEDAALPPSDGEAERSSRRVKETADAWRDTNDTIKKSTEEALTEIERLNKNTVERMGSAVGEFAKSVLRNFNDLGDAAAALSNRIADALVDRFIVDPLVNAATSAIGGLLGGILPFQSGGFLPPGRIGLVGERGPELIFAGSGARIVSNDDLLRAVQGRGGGGSGVTVNLTVHAEASQSEVYRGISAATPGLIQAVQTAIAADAARPSAFGSAVRGY